MQRESLKRNIKNLKEFPTGCTSIEDKMGINGVAILETLIYCRGWEMGQNGPLGRELT